MRLPLPKIKIKFKLRFFLWVLLFAAIVAEGLIVYSSLFAMRTEVNILVFSEKYPKPDFNLAKFYQLQEWLWERENYQLEEYVLEKKEIGRENPFADY